MGKQKKDGITWCDRTWNPLRGCTRVSEGCRNCYAERTAARFAGEGEPFHGFALPTADGPRWTGKVELVERHLRDPLTWREPATVFVNSMSDTFHDTAVREGMTSEIYDVIVESKRHVFLVLTKRADEMREWLKYEDDYKRGNPSSLARGADDLRHVWHGVSVEDQKVADERIPLLLDTPCAHRWLSMEPLIGPVTLKPEWLGPGKIEWIVVGGESGAGARPMNIHWVRSIGDTCARNNTRFHFKQWGEWLPGTQYTSAAIAADPCPEGSRFPCQDWNGEGWEKTAGQWCDNLSDAAVFRVGKKAAGRELDGMTYDWMPRPEVRS